MVFKSQSGTFMKKSVLSKVTKLQVQCLEMTLWSILKNRMSTDLHHSVQSLDSSPERVFNPTPDAVHHPVRVSG